MKKILLACLISFQASFMIAQYFGGVTYPDTTVSLISDTSLVNLSLAQSITTDDLHAHLAIIASDEFEGRETGEPGNELAANYIAQHFKSLNLVAPVGGKSYFQDVAFTFSRWNDISLEVNGNSYKHLWDYIAFPTKNDSRFNFQTNSVIFLGYGIESDEYSDYKGKSVAGKTIMIYSGDPRDESGNSRITGSQQNSDWDDDKKLQLAKSKGAELVLIIKGDIKGFLETNRRLLVGGSMELGDKRLEERMLPDHLYISTTVAREIMANQIEKTLKSRDRIIKKGKSCQVKMKPDMLLNMDKNQSVLLSKNVMAYIEGSEKPDELIVVSAHYDHIGKKGKDVFNGADDNGTGTCTVLELAQAYTEAINNGNRPKRSVLLLLVTGEEKGLLGSAYYASNPIFPLENTIANINIDMIGRRDDKHENDNYIYVIGSDRLSSELHTINEQINQDYTQMELDYAYNDEEDPNRFYYRSDHYNFAKNGIPAIFFFSGVHEDYHRPGDTVDKINFDKLERTARHIFHLSWELANRAERITADKVYR